MTPAYLLGAFFSALLALSPVMQRGTPPLKGNIKADLERLLPTGTMQVDVIDRVIASPRRVELMVKFVRALQQNPEWAEEMAAYKARTGKAAPYSPKCGLPESEWEELLKFMADNSDMYSVSSGTTRLKILRKGGMIHFQSPGVLGFMDSVTIDPVANVVRIGNTKLPFRDTIHVPTPKNVMKTSWHGYLWQYASGLDGPTPTDRADLARMRYKLFSVTIGRLDSDGATYMSVKINVFDRGRYLVNFETPFRFIPGS